MSSVVVPVTRDAAADPLLTRAERELQSYAELEAQPFTLLRNGTPATELLLVPAMIILIQSFILQVCRK
jgi:hypothetical protein